MIHLMVMVLAVVTLCNWLIPRVDPTVAAERDLARRAQRWAMGRSGGRR